MRNIFRTLCFVWTMFASADAQNISHIEYYFNTDPGFGMATAITGFTPSQNIANFPASINLSTVSEGVNHLYVRALDNSGGWSITNVIPFVKVDLTLYNIVSAEYFMNTDPGVGNGVPFTLPSLPNISQQSVALDVTSALPGINTLYIRTKDAGGKWSLTNRLAFVKGSVAGDVSSLEYFIDTDPGFGLATPVGFTPAQNISNFIFNADVSALADSSTHNLFIRSKDADGIWSLTNILSFVKISGVGVDEITDASALFAAMPNPAVDKITVTCSSDLKMDQVELLDVQGKLIKVETTGNPNEKVIDISTLREGIYFIRITSGSDVVYKKIVKQ